MRETEIRFTLDDGMEFSTLHTMTATIEPKTVGDVFASAFHLLDQSSARVKEIHITKRSDCDN